MQVAAMMRDEVNRIGRMLKELGTYHRDCVVVVDG